MLARTVGPRYDRYPCYVQPKLNGVRALFQKTKETNVFQSRDEKVWSNKVLHHLHEELNSIQIGDLILDGELYKHGWRLQRINGAVATNRSQPRDDTHEVCFHVFDVVDLEQNFGDRFLDIYNALLSANLPHIIPVPTAIASSWREVEQHFHLYTSTGYEGVMLRPSGRYEFGEHLGRNGTMTQYRSKTLWKHKAWEDDEFAVIGATDGEGKADIGIGALICVTKNNIKFGVGTGLTDQDRIEFSQSLPKVVKVRYLCLTEEGKPFNPSFMCVMS